MEVRAAQGWPAGRWACDDEVRWPYDGVVCEARATRRLKAIVRLGELLGYSNYEADGGDCDGRTETAQAAPPMHCGRVGWPLPPSL